MHTCVAAPLHAPVLHADDSEALEGAVRAALRARAQAEGAAAGPDPAAAALPPGGTALRDSYQQVSLEALLAAVPRARPVPGQRPAPLQARQQQQQQQQQQQPQGQDPAPLQAQQQGQQPSLQQARQQQQGQAGDASRSGRTADGHGSSVGGEEEDGRASLGSRGVALEDSSSVLSAEAARLAEATAGSDSSDTIEAEEAVATAAAEEEEEEEARAGGKAPGGSWGVEGISLEGRKGGLTNQPLQPPQQHLSVGPSEHAQVRHCTCESAVQRLERATALLCFASSKCPNGHLPSPVVPP